MMSRFLKTALITALVIATGLPRLNAQSFDYQKYPQLSINITDLSLDMDVNPEAYTLSGSANYIMMPRIAGVDTLVLHAAHMEIENVTVNNKKAVFRLHNDSLFISLSDSAEVGESFELSIDYSTSPKFGMHKNESGTLWTSLLPAGTRHWLPTVDHPRVAFKSTMNITVPSGYSLVASGKQQGEVVEDVGSVTYTFKTGHEVPATKLSFALGRFNTRETSYGIKNISLSSEQGLLAEDKHQKLLEQSYRILKETEQFLGMEFPFDQLNIAVLRDHRWETASWGAGTLWLYSNQGSMEAQLRRGIYAQWFGVHHRPEQWAEGVFYPLIHAAIHFQLTDENRLLDKADIPSASTETSYNDFGIDTWNFWQQNFSNKIDASWRQTVVNSLQDIATWQEGVYASSDYAAYWYSQTGQPRFSLPSFKTDEGTSADTDTTGYEVYYTLNEEEGKLKLTFKAKEGMVKELLTLPFITVTGGSRDTSEVTFTGREDSVVVSVPALVETAYIDASSEPSLGLEQYQPASFLIYEVRNGVTRSDRARAAGKLGYHADNPDLQLAIRDMLTQEMEAPVKAALLQSFAQITDGASGTEQVFLDAMKSANSEVRTAALMALQNYPDNQAAVSSIRSFAGNASSLNDFRTATNIYSSVADTSSFKGFVNTMVQQDTAGFKAIYAIQELANRGGTDQAITLAEYYVSEVYDYSIRASALGILLQHDKATEDWRSRAEELLDDVDPRIRFLTVTGLSNIPGLDLRAMLSAHVQDEYDARVHAAMQRLLSD